MISRDFREIKVIFNEINLRPKFSLKTFLQFQFLTNTQIQFEFVLKSIEVKINIGKRKNQKKNR